MQATDEVDKRSVTTRVLPLSSASGGPGAIASAQSLLGPSGPPLIRAIP